MPYDWNQHVNRIAMRSDLTTWLSHLTRATFDPPITGAMTASALDVLLTILEQRRLNGSTNAGFVSGRRPAVCLQDTPVFNLGEMFYQEKVTKDADHPPANSDEHDGNHNRYYRYCLFGISVPKSSVWDAGGRPVFYDDSDHLRDILPEDEWWRNR